MRQEKIFKTIPEARNWIGESKYNTYLYKPCDETGIKRFCMHAHRHTYATRAIKSGIQPKVLQKFLGHASIQTAMDRYVHVTDEFMGEEIKQFSLNGVMVQNSK